MSLQVYVCLLEQRMFGGLIGIHSAFGLADAFHLELAT